LAFSTATPTPGSSADLRYMPDDAEVVGGVDLDAVVASPLYRKLTEPGSKWADKLRAEQDMVRTELGLDLADIRAMTVGQPPNAGNKRQANAQVQFRVIGAPGQPPQPPPPQRPAANGVTAIRSRKTMSVSQIKQNRGGDYQERKVGKYGLWENNNTAFCLVDETAELRKVLERDGPPRLSPEMQMALKHVESGKAAWIVQAAKPTAKADTPAVPPLFPQLEKHVKKYLEPFTKVKASVIHIDLKSGVEVTGKSFCEDAKTAEQMRRFMSGLGSIVRGVFLILSVDTESKGYEQALQALDAGSVKADGSVLSFKFALNMATINDLLDKASELFNSIEVRIGVHCPAFKRFAHRLKAECYFTLPVRHSGQRLRRL
jgi:hypothetical protein